MSEPEDLERQVPAEGTSPTSASAEASAEAPAKAPASAEASDEAQAAVDASESAAASAAAEASASAPAAEALAATAPAPVKRRHPFYLRGRRFRLRLPKSRRGLFALLLVLSAVGFVGIFAGVSVISWTETADFCGRCHTMAPELQAYSSGSHRNVTCGECHVEPGVAGWVKAKMNGTRQLIDTVLGTYPTPIHPPEHDHMPTAEETCQECHSLDQRQFVGLRTLESFAEDSGNTRNFVGLMVRPTGGDPFDVDRSVHNHVALPMEYAGTGLNGAEISYVEATRADGSVVEYISQDKIVDADNVLPEIEAIKAADELIEVNCYDCHNRVGHDITNPREALDYMLQVGTIDDSLPFIKRESQRILWTAHPDEAAAFAEIDRLEEFYRVNYPEVYGTKLAQIRGAIVALRDLYPRTALPAMEVTPATYPNQKSHQDYPGCFRCHDGGHFRVEDGVAMSETIPSTCNTCHTFPQIGPAVASLPLGEPPSTHEDDLWVFSHANVAGSIDPAETSCVECHAQDYCVNCHSTGAISVDHDEMSTNHAEVIRQQGNQSCAYCHQPVYCARCHKEPVLPVTSPAYGTQPTSGGSEPGGSEPEGAAPEGLAWPAPQGLAWPLNPHAAWNARFGVTGAATGAGSDD